MQPIVSVAPFLFLINIRSEALIEYVSQTDLKLPTFAVIQVSGEASGRIITITVFVHIENRSVALILTLIGQNSSTISAGHIFRYTPFAVQQVTYIQDIQAELQRILSFANLHEEVTTPTEIKAVHPRSTCRISFGIFAFMLLQLRVLIHKLPESICIFGTRELDFIFSLRDINKIIGYTIAIHIIRVHKTITTG